MPATDTRRTTRIIPLDLSSVDYPAVRFLRAEVNAGHYAPFALIRYSVRGIEKSKALRLDLDKRVFIDPSDLEASEEFIEATSRAAPIIAERVSREAWRWFSTER